MQTRGFAGTAILLAGITAAPFGFLVSITQQIPFGDGMVAGVIFGVLFGLIMATMLKAKSETLQWPDNERAEDQVQRVLAEVGYHPQTKIGSTITFKPSFQAGLLSGQITVTIGQGEVTIVGPSRYVDKIKNKLRAA